MTEDSKHRMDFFSELPDPILEHILSDLLLKDGNEHIWHGTLIVVLLKDGIQ